MSSGRCGAACAPSHTTIAPARRAIALISATGLIVPSAFDTWLNATTFVRGPTSDASWSRSTPPSLVSVADAELRADADRELLPGDEVRVMLEPRDDDLVAGAHVRASPRRRDEVERLGRAAREDQSRRVLHADELARCARARRDTAPSLAPTARRRRDAGSRCRACSSASSRRARRAASATSPPNPGSADPGSPRAAESPRGARSCAALGPTSTRPLSTRTGNTGNGSSAGPRHTCARAAVEARAVPRALERAVVAQRRRRTAETRRACTSLPNRADACRASLNRQTSSPSDRFTPSSVPSGRSSTSARYSNSLMRLRSGGPTRRPSCSSTRSPSPARAPNAARARRGSRTSRAAGTSTRRRTRAASRATACSAPASLPVTSS